MLWPRPDVDRLESLQGFKQVVAPFDGHRDRARNRHRVHSSMPAATARARELFSVADTHKVRIYVKVPQRQAANIHTGLTAELRPAAISRASLYGKGHDDLTFGQHVISNAAGRTSGRQPDGLLQARDLCRSSVEPSARSKHRAHSVKRDIVPAAMDWKPR